MALYFEDFIKETEFASRGRTITEADVVNFAGLSGDFVELHTNEEYARNAPFGRRIAHGALVFSISIGLWTQMGLVDDTVIAFYGIDRLRFTKPVFIGDTVRVLKVVAEKMVVPKGGLVTFDTRVLNHRGDVVLIYMDKLLLQRRE